MKIIWLRHGQADNNLSHVIESRLNSPANLTAKGRQQVELAAASPSLQNIAAVYVSPLNRTRQTYEVAAAHNSAIKAAPQFLEIALKEINQGAYEGKNVGRFPLVFPFGWQKFFGLIGGRNFHLGGGESYHDVECRIGEWLLKIAKIYPMNATILAISHADTILAAQFLAREIDRHNPRARIPKNASLTVTKFSRKDFAKLKSLLKSGKI
ncbi:MAG: histidine phosphatase family protein [Candidatus Nomurabacteria bacterium]|nr:histidine phosphatase family protein [Candidatus Nomurabacteria bacterium]